MKTLTRVGVGVLLASLLLPAAASAEPEVELLGSWYMLIHYRDSLTANPDVDRWDDKLWIFEKKGSRLQWTEYPIVVFKEKEGRFGTLGANHRSRMLHAWEPNEAQQAEIDRGLQVNSRGSKRKSLRGSSTRGYKSFSAQRTISAATVGYKETWTIDSPAALPVFTRDDALGTEAALASRDQDGVASGRTRFTTLEVSQGGRVLSGKFSRDENRIGTFRMQQAGTPKDLESDGRTPNQKASDRFMGQ
jgi:hypothetical protein